MNPFLTIPLEIWEIITVHSWNDLERTYILKANEISWFAQNSKKFDKMLQRHKSAYLFEKVLGVIISKLNKEEVYHCRRVCKRWTTAIDRFLENPPCFQIYSENVSLKIPSSTEFSSDAFFQFGIRLLTEERLQLFEQIGVTLGNPFIGRSITISPDVSQFGWENEFAEHFSPKIERLCTILERFGKLIYHLDWAVLSPGVSDFKFYAMLCRFLSYLPNLKTLRIRFWVTPTHDSSSTLIDIENLLMPQNSFLHYVDFNILNLSGYIEQKILMSLGTAVRKLCLPISHNMINAIHEGLSNLNELNIRSIYDFELFAKLISKLAELKLPVQKFSGEFSRHFEITEILNQVCVLNLKVICFGKSELKDDREYYHHESESREYGLTTIHTCEIWDNLGVYYNFLKLLPNLSCLIVTRCDLVEKWYQNLYDGQTLQNNKTNVVFVMDLLRQCVYMEKAPSDFFWKTFPNLKRIIVKSSVEYSGFRFPTSTGSSIISQFFRPYNF